MTSLGIVVIGRNEGERLRLCLESLSSHRGLVVYVDSGSTDASIGLARSLGAEVVELDTSIPFSAARARNEGFNRLTELDPNIDYIQFVDGDCEIIAGWLARACVELDARPDVAIVCGRVRERHPDHSIYNRMADIEWDTPLGASATSGGLFTIRARAFRVIGGFNRDIIAAEDDEICLRLRRLGWVIVKVDAEMATHDLAMTRFGQWWRRSVRTGYAFADGASRHGKAPEQHFVRQLRSVLAWGAVLPAMALAASWPTQGLSLLVVPALYVAQATRICVKMLRLGRQPRAAWDYGLFCMLGKLPQAVGLFMQSVDRLTGRQGKIIEHKRASATFGVVPVRNI